MPTQAEIDEQNAERAQKWEAHRLEWLANEDEHRLEFEQMERETQRIATAALRVYALMDELGIVFDDLTHGGDGGERGRWHWEEVLEEVKQNGSYWGTWEEERRPYLADDSQS